MTINYSVNIRKYYLKSIYVQFNVIIHVPLGFAAFTKASAD